MCVYVYRASAYKNANMATEVLNTTHIASNAIKRVFGWVYLNKGYNTSVVCKLLRREEEIKHIFLVK